MQSSQNGVENTSAAPCNSSRVLTREAKADMRHRRRGRRHSSLRRERRRGRRVRERRTVHRDREITRFERDSRRGRQMHESRESTFIEVHIENGRDTPNRAHIDEVTFAPRIPTKVGVYI